MNKIKILISFLAIGLLLSEMAFSQSAEPSMQELENVLSRFINYRFGTVSIYKLKNASDVKRALKVKSEVGAGKKEAEELLKTLDPVIAQMISLGAQGGEECDKIRENIINEGKIPPPQAVFEKICTGLKSGGTETDQVENAYLITGRPELGQLPTNIIALITTDRATDDLERNLRSRSTSDIYTFEEMKQFRLDTSFSAPNLFELMVNSVIQGNIENKTLDAQGIGNPEWFSSKTFGKTSSLSVNETDVSSYDIQKFKRISEVQPMDYYYRPNEVIASMDLISWKRYEQLAYTDANGNTVVDSFTVLNANLPEFGLEMKYGIENISYPSFWSERITVSALWHSVKLGLILPTSGWSSLSKSFYNIKQRLTSAGFGIAGSFDFPFKVVPQSGVFHMDFGYTFGDASEPGYKTKPTIDNYTGYANDYLIRTNVQLHYTFGVQVDNDYWFRFGIGGTLYTAEKWNYKSGIDENGDDVISYNNMKTETMGGLSGKFEFLAKNILTPFGASVQYFDEALGAKLWLQIPVITDFMALRFEADGYFVAFRHPHEWEEKSVFMPQLRLIFNF
jgi:hypothetical protein